MRNARVHRRHGYLGAGAGGRRVPLCEHAYNLETATLVGHPPRSGPRVGFPSCQRSWNSQPRAVRCPDCDTAVQYIVRDLIVIAIAAITGFDDCPSSANSSPPM